MTDTEIDERILQNLKAARRANVCIVSWLREHSDDELMDRMVNTIGIQAAEVMTMAADLSGSTDYAEDVMFVLLQHINTRMDILRSENEPVQ